MNFRSATSEASRMESCVDGVMLETVVKLATIKLDTDAAEADVDIL